jgi:hypothetical protein
MRLDSINRPGRVRHSRSPPAVKASFGLEDGFHDQLGGNFFLNSDCVPTSGRIGLSDSGCL